MLLTNTQIEQLLNQEVITEEWPWSTNNEKVINKNIKDIVAEICLAARLEDKTEYNHYGSGYASFVDCWLHRPDNDFRFHIDDNCHSYHGLVVLFSRLSPFYVLGQGDKSWNKTGSSSYAPDFDFVDGIEHPAVLKLVPSVTDILAKRGLEQLHRSELDTILPVGFHVPTIMAGSVLRHFDALFYWED